MQIDKKIKDLIIKNISDIELIILALLNAKNREPIRDDVFFQKEIFLILNFIRDVFPKADFIPHTFGPYSEVAEKALENLQSYKLVDKTDKGYTITTLGNDIFEKLKNKIPKDELEAIEDFKDFLNNLTRDELLVFTYISFPEFTAESAIKKRVYSKRKAIAVSLYKKGKISLEKAAFLSGMPLEEFIRYIKDHERSKDI